MTTYIGSSRHDENGKYLGGKAGDQLQVSGTFDTTGEVSMQTLNKFAGTRAWYILRPKRADHAIALAQAMKLCCNNKHVGYDQRDRNEVVAYGIDTTSDVDSDCGSNVRACIIYAMGKDVGNFTTSNEKSVLEQSKLFDRAIIYRAGITKVYEGDVFVTQTKGHTGICVQGLSRVIQKSPETYIYQGVDYSPVFNPVYYSNKYSDLKAAYGEDAKALFTHFYTFGMKEGRQACLTFNVQVYRERYVDLREAFGDNLPMYYWHYCTHLDENRQAY